MDKVLFSSKKMDWETPAELFSKMDEIFRFSLDVAANERNKKCDMFYSINEDGLKKSWKQVGGGGLVQPSVRQRNR